MAKRRSLTSRSTEDWENLIKECLYNSKHTMKWGCLNKKGKLFRIRTLNSIQVPMGVIKTLENSGVLELRDEMGLDDYYKYVPPEQPKKRVRRSI